VPTRAARSYQEHARTGAKGMVPGAGLEPACACLKGRPGCRQSTPDCEPSFGADPNLPPYKGGVTAVRDGKSPSEAGTRTPGCLLAPPIDALFSLVRAPGRTRTGIASRHWHLEPARLPDSATSA
jgi:hypothetical protein